MKYRCKVCNNMIDEYDIQHHIVTWHPDEVLEEVQINAVYLVDKLVDYSTSKESPQ